MEDTIQAMRDALDAAEAAREAILLRHMANGVLIDSRTVCIDETVQIAPGARILPGTILRGRTVIRPRLCHRAQHPHRGQRDRRRHHRPMPARSTPPRSAPTTPSGPSPMCGRAPSPTTASIWEPMWRPKIPTWPGAIRSAI